MRLSVECVFSYLGKRSVTSRKDALCFCDLTKKRILQPQRYDILQPQRYDIPQPQRYEKAHFDSLVQGTRHQKAHSATFVPPRLRFSVTRGAAKGRRLCRVPLQLTLAYVEKRCRGEAVSVPQISLVNLTSEQENSTCDVREGCHASATCQTAPPPEYLRECRTYPLRHHEG